MNHLLLLTALLSLPTQAQTPLPQEVSAVHSYRCTGTFLEGEGVSPYSIYCPANQRLGFLFATHTAYLFSSKSGSNMARKRSDTAYSSPLCEKRVQRLGCGSANTKPDFGLSRQPEGLFQAKVILSPDFSAYSQIYGYAALPDAGGACPPGLVKARFYEARPETIQSPLPTSFSNEYGSQNDRILHVEGTSLPYFAVHRSANTKPCDEVGSCRNSLVGPKELAQVTAYEPLPEKPALCVIPPSAMD